MARSFGKFHGLAGVRLGFALGAARLVDRLALLARPWAVSGPAQAIGRAALSDAAWREAMIGDLLRDAARLDAMAATAGWRLAGGTALFGLYDVCDAASVQKRLARRFIWSRNFGYAPGWLRLGLPGPEAEWARLRDALG